MKPINNHLIVEDTDQPKPMTTAGGTVLYTPPTEQTHIRKYKVAVAGYNDWGFVGGEFVSVRVKDAEPFFDGKFIVAIENVVAAEGLKDA